MLAAVFKFSSFPAPSFSSRFPPGKNGKRKQIKGRIFISSGKYTLDKTPNSLLKLVIFQRPLKALSPSSSLVQQRLQPQHPPTVSKPRQSSLCPHLAQRSALKRWSWCPWPFCSWLSLVSKQVFDMPSMKERERDTLIYSSVVVLWPKE